jgi:hypothetical protein
MIKRRAILIDSNAIVRRDWLLRSAAWKVVLFNARDGHIQLVVPELVVKESVGRYRAALAEALERLTTAEADLSRLGVELSVPDVSTEEQIGRHDATLRARVLGAGGLIPELPAIQLSHLVDKAIGRTRPFDQQGNGFRDALLWEHVLALLDQFEPVVLITNDRAAFHESKEQLGLAPALAGEVVGKGYPVGSVVVYPDLGAYLKAIGTYDPKTYAAVAEVIAADEAQVATNLEVALGRANIELRDGHGRIVIEQAHEPVSVSLVDVSALDDQKVALVTLEGDADLDLYVEWWDGTEPDTGSTTKTVTYTANATFDAETGLLDDFSVGILSVEIDRDRLSGFGPFIGSGALWRGDEPLL